MRPDVPEAKYPEGYFTTMALPPEGLVPGAVPGKAVGLENVMVSDCAASRGVVEETFQDERVIAPPSAGADIAELVASVEVVTVAPILLGCGDPIVRPENITVVADAARMAVVSCTVNALSPVADTDPAIPDTIVGVTPA